MGAFESGQAFAAGVLAKLPEELRTQAKAIFDAAEAKDAVVAMGDGALARADYSKSKDVLREQEQALQDHYERLNSWYTVNQGALEEAKALKEREAAARTGMVTSSADAKAPDPQPTAAQAAAAFSLDDVRRIADEAVNNSARDQLAVNAFVSSTGLRHLYTFGEPLDMLDLVQNPKLGRPVAGQPGRIYSLQDAYFEKYGDRLQAKQKEWEEKRFNDEVEKRLAERTKSATPHPFPLRSEASPLDVLQTKDGSAAHTLDTAVAEYERLQAARGA